MKKLFDQPEKNSIRTCEHIPKIATGQGDDYTTKQYKLILLKT